MAQNAPIKKIIRESPNVVRLRKKRRNARVRLVVLFSVLFVVVVYGLIFLSRRPNLQIVNIEVTGNQVISSTEIINHVEQFLFGNYVYVIPKRNIYLYPGNMIRQSLLASFPRVETVSIHKKSDKIIVVNIKEAKAVALWCGKEFLPINPDVECYFTDRDGKIVDKAPYYSGDIYTRLFGGVVYDKNSSPLGKYVLVKDEFSKLLKFADDVSRLGIDTTDINIGEKGEYQLMIHLGSGLYAPIRFLAKDDIQTLLSNLTAAVTKPELAKKYKEGKERLQYFDLRYKNKVYYKFSEKTVVN